MKIHTPIGFLWLDADESGLTAVSFQPISESESANQQILTRTQEQSEEYFAGKRKEFDVPLSIKRGWAGKSNQSIANRYSLSSSDRAKWKTDRIYGKRNRWG